MSEEDKVSELKSKIEALTKKTKNLDLFFERHQICKDIEGAVWKRLSFWILFIFSFFGLGVWQSYEFIQRSLADKFLEPNIQSALTKAAESKAKDILTEQVGPAVLEMKKQTQIATKDFKNDLTNLRSRYYADYQNLKDELKYLKDRNMLTRLADKAISSGSRDSYDELNKILNTVTLPEMKEAALSDIFKIKIHYVSGSRVNEFDLTTEGPLGQKYLNKENSTITLMNDALKNSSWRVRARAVEFLGGRKEEDVPETLLYVIRHDKRLEVVAAAVRSFIEVTKIRTGDVFGEDGLQERWEKEKDSIMKSLS